MTHTIGSYDQHTPASLRAELMQIAVDDTGSLNSAAYILAGMVQDLQGQVAALMSHATQLEADMPLVSQVTEQVKAELPSLSELQRHPPMAKQTQFEPLDEMLSEDEKAFYRAHPDGNIDAPSGHWQADSTGKLIDPEGIVAAHFYYVTFDEDAQALLERVAALLNREQDQASGQWGNLGHDEAMEREEHNWEEMGGVA